jgi:hypothetical protein
MDILIFIKVSELLMRRIRQLQAATAATRATVISADLVSLPAIAAANKGI